jgi:hypothetical protein
VVRSITFGTVVFKGVKQHEPHIIGRKINCGRSSKTPYLFLCFKNILRIFYFKLIFFIFKSFLFYNIKIIFLKIKKYIFK